MEDSLKMLQNGNMDEKDTKPKKAKGKRDEDIQKLQEELKNLEDQLKRAVADYRNLENRIREEKQDFVKFANKTLIESLLPAFDTLFLAAKYTEDESVQLTAKHVIGVLANVGVVQIETVGKHFDPHTMECIEVVLGEKDIVIEETQPGFELNGKILRPARVKVGGDGNEAHESQDSSTTEQN